MLIARREHTDHQKKLIIGVITACCVTCTLIYMVFHRICRVCIKAPTVIAWAYQFISMLPASMCYAGSPCATLKCALLTFIITSDVSASCISFVNTFYHSFRTMVVLEQYLWFYVHPRWSGDHFFAWILLSMMFWWWCSWMFSLASPPHCSHPDPTVPYPFPAFPSPSLNPPLPSEFHPPPLSGFYPPPFSEFYPPPFYEFYLPPSVWISPTPFLWILPTPFLNFTHPLFMNFTYPLFLNFTHSLFLNFTPSPSDSPDPPDPVFLYSPHIQIQTEMLLTFAIKSFTSSNISFLIFMSSNSPTNDTTIVKQKKKNVKIDINLEKRILIFEIHLN